MMVRSRRRIKSASLRPHTSHVDQTPAHYPRPPMLPRSRAGAELSRRRPVAPHVWPGCGVDRLGADDGDAAGRPSGCRAGVGRPGRAGRLAPVLVCPQRQSGIPRQVRTRVCSLWLHRTAPPRTTGLHDAAGRRRSGRWRGVVSAIDAGHVARGVVYRALPEALGTALAIDMQAVWRSGDTRHAVRDVVALLRAGATR